MDVDEDRFKVRLVAVPRQQVAHPGESVVEALRC
jgi:hypothetical protein